jgi:TolB-like protein/class 3 adenylate cyclase
MNPDTPSRRLAAILALDVVGYSRLVEQDETATLAALTALRADVVDPALASHRGRIVKVMGDGLIAEFSSVVDAVSCAIEVQRASAKRQSEDPAARRIVLRIGVNLGDVVVDGDDLLGDGVNIAARLEQICEPGGVLLSGTAFDHLQGKLPLPVDFAGEQRVKNIDRAIRTYRVRMDGAGRPRWAWRPSGRALAAGVAILAVLAGAAAWLLWRTPSASARASVAVLPFNAYAGDDATARLAAGVTEDVITDLARFRDLDVIARNSTEVYKNKPVDIRAVGKDLGARYVLEGSIQREGDQMRVTAQLIDSTTGTHVWTDRWDRPAKDIFAIQTEVSERVASTLGGYNLLTSLGRAAAKRKRPSDLEAYDLYLLGVEAFLGNSERDLERGLDYENRALERDPQLVRAMLKKGWIIFNLRKFKKNDDEAYVQMEQLANAAIALDPQDAEAHVLLSYAAANFGRNAESLDEIRKAIALNPSSADILNQASDQMPWVGLPEEGAALCDRSFALNPHPPFWYYSGCMSSYAFVGRHKEAVAAAEHSGPLSSFSRGRLVLLAMSAVEVGRKDLVDASIAEINKRYPEMSIEKLLNTVWVFDRAQERDLTIALAGRAGVRMCATEQELKGVSPLQRLPRCIPKASAGG